MRLSVYVLALCVLIIFGFSLSACKSQAPTQVVTPSPVIIPDTETPVVSVEDTPGIEGYPTPANLGLVVPTQKTPVVDTPAVTAPLQAPIQTPVPTASVYPAPVTQPTIQTTSGYPPPLPTYPSSYPPPITPVEYSNAYPGPGTPIVTPSPGNPSNVTPTPVTAQISPIPSAFSPTLTSIPTTASGSIPATTTTPPAAPAQASTTSTPTTMPYIVRTGLYATDPATVVLAAGKPQLVEFFARWSTTSKSMAPVINRLEMRYHERMSFIYLDVDDRGTNPFKQALGYRYPPQFFLLDGQGKVVNQWSGYVKVEELDAALKAMVGQ